jgi:diadenosine tetraphosphatase ApaH/serine/threonine PP2A family protein phosphatase
MRALVISDVHSNIEALRAVIADARAQGGFDATWCAGDIVGYGPDPLAVLDELRALDAVCVCGNHDLAACGLMGVEDFNNVAAAAALWTRETLDDAAKAAPSALPKVNEVEGVTLVHGSLRAPEWEYLLEPDQAEAHFALQTAEWSIVGHSHLQFVCHEQRDAPPRFHATSDGERISLAATRVILNPGSVGQPRDGDPRAGYLLLDTAARTATWHRVVYDIEATQQKIIAAGLPSYLGSRLSAGR